VRPSIGLRNRITDEEYHQLLAAVGG